MSKIWMSTLDDENERVEGSLIGKLNLDYKITNNISATLESNLNQYTWTSEYKTFAKDANRLDGAYGMGNGEKFQYSFSGKLFFNKEINDDFRLDLILGGEMWSTETKSTSIGTNGGFKIRDFFSRSEERRVGKRGRCRVA